MFGVGGVSYLVNDVYYICFSLYQNQIFNFFLSAITIGKTTEEKGRWVELAPLQTDFSFVSLTTLALPWQTSIFLYVWKPSIYRTKLISRFKYSDFSNDKIFFSINHQFLHQQTISIINIRKYKYNPTKPTKMAPVNSCRVME